MFIAVHFKESGIDLEQSFYLTFTSRENYREWNEENLSVELRASYKWNFVFIKGVLFKFSCDNQLSNPLVLGHWRIGYRTPERAMCPFQRPSPPWLSHMKFFPHFSCSVKTSISAFSSHSSTGDSRNEPHWGFSNLQLQLHVQLLDLHFVCSHTWVCAEVWKTSGRW